MIILFLFGIIAGIVEASAGGSGLISLPAIMLYGYQPIEAVATSKFQYGFGALTAIVRYTKAGLVHWRDTLPLVLGAIVSGALGAYVLALADPEIVALIVPFFLILTAIYFLWSPRISDVETSPRMNGGLFGALVIPVIAFYDGFFGVGSASFYMTAFVLLRGMHARAATANTKLVDFASGMAALIVLALKGHVLLVPGLALGAGQIVGSYFGSAMVIRHGARWVKPLIVIVTVALSIDLLRKHWAKVLEIFG